MFAAILAAISAGPVRADFYAGLEAHARGDYAKAHAEWLPLAEAGDASAQANLGVMYWQGQGVDADPAEAVRWFLRAARAAVRDDYVRRRSKRARDYPHKKRDTPPGPPKLLDLTTAQKTQLQRLETLGVLGFG